MSRAYRSWVMLAPWPLGSVTPALTGRAVLLPNVSQTSPAAVLSPPSSSPRTLRTHKGWATEGQHLPRANLWGTQSLGGRFHEVTVGNHEPVFPSW